MFKKVPIMYISGPFSSDDIIHGVELNVLKASKYALEAWKKGWGVICPHKNTQGFQHVDLPYSDWMSGDLSIIDRLDPLKGDAVLMLPDWKESNGAKLEHIFAESKKLKIYYAEEGIPSVEEF